MGPNPIKKDSFNGYLHRHFQPLHPKSTCEITLPFHEKKRKKFQSTISVWKSLPLHQSQVWTFRQASCAEFSHTIRNSNTMKN